MLPSTGLGEECSRAGRILPALALGSSKGPTSIPGCCRCPPRSVDRHLGPLWSPCNGHPCTGDVDPSPSVGRSFGCWGRELALRARRHLPEAYAGAPACRAQGGDPRYGKETSPRPPPSRFVLAPKGAVCHHLSCPATLFFMGKGNPETPP